MGGVPYNATDPGGSADSRPQHESANTCPDGR